MIIMNKLLEKNNNSHLHAQGYRPTTSFLSNQQTARAGVNTRRRTNNVSFILIISYTIARLSVFAKIIRRALAIQGLFRKIIISYATSRCIPSYVRDKLLNRTRKSSSGADQNMIVNIQEYPRLTGQGQGGWVRAE
jgi:hypothetical protein